MTDAPLLLESLAETRVSILYLARRARETGDKDTAKELAAQAASLQSEIARLRRAAHAAWPAEATALSKKFDAARSRLTKIVEGVEKDRRRLQSAVRLLTVVRGVVAMSARLGPRVP